MTLGRGSAIMWHVRAGKGFAAQTRTDFATPNWFEVNQILPQAGFGSNWFEVRWLEAPLIWSLGL